MTEQRAVDISQSWRPFSGSESCPRALQKESATPPHVHPTSKYVTAHVLPGLLLQATNAGVRSPGNDRGYVTGYYTSSFARFAHSATSPSLSNPAPDSSLCRAAAPRLHPLQLLLLDCICFSCCSPLHTARLCTLRLLLLIPNCVCFNCCSPIVSASTAAPRLHASACSPHLCPGPLPMFSNILCGVRGSVI